ncbi:MAG: YkgJ family cysteine cluster protein [Paracoccaceae bacterium]|nr:YkgJ family cysteine cluster protein [Paracoccaceae bacterium]
MKGEAAVAKAARNGIESVDALKKRILRARARGAARPVEDQARRALLTWVETAGRHGLTLRDILSRLASGEAARAIGRGVHDALESHPPPVLAEAACRSGCAFCCILSGGEGGTISEAEARAVHGALAALGAMPSGRDWHPSACPALDPATRTCRIYADRPVLCRSFVSTDAAACEANAEGGSEAGAGLLGSHPVYLAALGLSRAALDGRLRVRTYALDRVAEAALAGAPLDAALDAARQRPRSLDDATRDSHAAIPAR